MDDKIVSRIYEGAFGAEHLLRTTHKISCEEKDEQRCE